MVRTELGSARHICPSICPPRIRKKRLPKNQISVYFSFFLYLEIRKKHFAHESRTNHGDIPTITTMASRATLLNQNSRFSADTLHVVGSYRLCERARSRSEKRKRRLSFCALPGGAQDGQKVAQSWIFLVNTLHVVGSYNNPSTCKVSASRMPGKSFGKMKTSFTMLGSHKTCERPKWQKSRHPTGIFR
jgi:hypothetical protein